MFLIFSNSGWLRQNNTTGKMRMAGMCGIPEATCSDEAIGCVLKNESLEFKATINESSPGPSQRNFLSRMVSGTGRKTRE